MNDYSHMVCKVKVGLALTLYYTTLAPECIVDDEVAISIKPVPVV